MIRHRHPRCTRMAVAALATFAASLAPAALAQATAQTCKPRHSTTLAGDGYARVYGKNGNAYVCVKANGRTTRLRGATPGNDVFALGGKYVAYSSGPQDSIVTVMHIPNRRVNPYSYPFDTNMHVEGIVVKSDGAAAWAATSPSDGSTLVQGTDRSNHPPDQFSDDSRTVVTTSLRSLHGKAIGWSYTDGGSGTATLY
jgi:hypothetical protein